MNIRKRDGNEVSFDRDKIKDAVLKALTAVDMGSVCIADKITCDVLDTVFNEVDEGKKPDVENIQDHVEEALMKRGLVRAARAYIRYRYLHQLVREHKLKGT